MSVHSDIAPATGRLPENLRRCWSGLQAGLPGHDVAEVAARRAACFAAADRPGLPDRRVEDWKFTSTAPLARLDPGKPVPADAASDARLAALLDGWPLDGACVLVIADGVWRPDLARGDLPEGVTLSRLSERPAGLAGLLQPLAGGAEMAPANLGLALAQEGALIEVAQDARPEVPLVLAHLSGGSATDGMQHLRHRLHCAAGAALTVVELHLTLAGAPFWSNLVTDMDLGPGARLDHLRIGIGTSQGYRTALLQGCLAAAACYAGTALILGGALVRDEIDLRLQGAGASCRLDGFSLADGRDHLDATLRVVHEAGGCSSNQHYRAVVDGHGHAVFQGRIAVAQDAQGSDAHQLARALLLSDQAMMDVKPELEILADDVKCSHGASIGDLDEQALFYLRARGIAPDAARALLIEAFAAEILEGIALPSWQTKAQAELALRLADIAARVREGRA